MSLDAINLDMFVSDPMLIIGSSLLVIGVVVFLISLWKLIRFDRTASFVIPEESEVALEDSVNEALSPEPEPEAEAIQELIQPMAPPNNGVVASAKAEPASDKTIVMPDGIADVQAQMDILVAQIKQMNKKMVAMEKSLEELNQQSISKIEPNELKELPMNPQDFTQKLLKLAEHVIVLEKEMAKMKNPGKTPIMPL